MADVEDLVSGSILTFGADLSAVPAGSEESKYYFLCHASRESLESVILTFLGNDPVNPPVFNSDDGGFMI